MRDSPDHLLPLAPATLHILLALAADDMHGYAIMQEVHRQSEGRYRIGPGTLYDNLARLVREGLVVEREQEARRKYYRLSAAGTKVLAAEIARLETVVRDARALLPAQFVSGAAR
jgi:DNA-binding PadR family transcriptional regulator